MSDFKVGLGVFALTVWALQLSNSAPAWASPPQSASPSPSVAPALAQEAPTLVPEKRKALLSNFKAALGVELRALEHRQRFELQELRAAQRAQKKDFQIREKEARKQAFRASTSGAEKRKWMEARESRWKALVALQASELEKRKQEHKVRRESLKHDQTERLKEFEVTLSKGTQPPERLWPQGT